MRVRALQACFVNNPKVPYAAKELGSVPAYRKEDGAFQAEGSVFEWHGEEKDLPNYLAPADLPEDQVPAYVAATLEREQRDTLKRAREARRKQKQEEAEAEAALEADKENPGVARLPGDPLPKKRKTAETADASVT